VNKSALIILSVISTAVLLGCSTPRQVTSVELRDLIQGSKGVQSTMWRGTYYCGTKDGFHYLRHTLAMGRDQLLKIPTNDLPLAVIGKYPLPKAEWVILKE
jgi:hypothetical protein